MGASVEVLEVALEEAVPQLAFEFIVEQMLLLFQIGFGWGVPR